MQTNGPTQKHSMLDKLKLFNKEKTDRSSKTQISKRTSSSSGFSSARSERSDSSLSLNDNQPTPKPATTVPTSNLKKPEIVTSKTKSKLLTNTTKNGSKDSLSSSGNKKSDKKEKDKSPARSNEMSESKIQAPKTQKIPTKVDNKLKPPSIGKKLDTRSESKTSLSSTASQIPAPKSLHSSTTSIPMPSGLPMSTAIPKPMAAIKGTTKPKIDQMNVSAEKMSANDISKQDISNGNQDGKMQIIAPIIIDNASTNQHIISQLQHQQVLSQQGISMNDSIHSRSTHSSNGPMTNSSESSIIYRPSSESGSEILSNARHRQMSPQSKLLFATNHHRRMNGSESMQQMMKVPSNGSIASSVASAPASAQSSQSSGEKFNTVPSKMLQTANGVIYEEEKQMNILPMRPLLRGYNSHLTLPTRGPRTQLAGDYCDDMSQGYCSDGDALRKLPPRFTDIENGYMSEGSSATTNGNGIHHKTFPGLLRARTQLPTTIEER